MFFLGKTLDDALKNAEDEFKRTRDFLKYEIVYEKKNIFKSEIKIEITGFLTEGKIGIENGNIIYEEGDILPEIEPGENAIIKINGKIVNKKTKVEKDDKIEFETIENISGKKIDIDISPDGMNAYISTQYKDNIKYKIMDKAVDTYIFVQTEIQKQNAPEKFTKEEVQNIIGEQKIKYGIKWENVYKILNGGRYLIAEGLYPEEAIDDNIKYFFNTERFNKPIEIDGKVDYYNIGDVEFVEKGTTLATKGEGKDGEKGYDIFGNVIPAKQRIIKKLFAGSGCELTDNSTKVIANAQGNPALKGEMVCIFASHTVNGDADIQCGNINFNGDVIIKGDLKEGIKVRAGNNLVIMGSTAEAVAVAGGNLTIGKNIISSTIKAGEKEYIDEQSLKYIKALKELYEIMISDYDILIKSGRMHSNLDPSIVLIVILQSKLQKQIESINEGIIFMKKNNIKKEALEVWNSAVQILQMIENKEVHSLSIISNINEKIDKFIFEFKIPLTPADIIFAYSQNSTIYATNNVEVRGKGCYNTNIVAENRVIIEGHPGVFRGGKIVAGKGVKLREVGSNAGVLTSIRTSKGSIIEADIIYQNTLITIGDQVYKFEEPAKNVKIYLNHGELIVEKLKL